jgi:hypothetical protein
MRNATFVKPQRELRNGKQPKIKRGPTFESGCPHRWFDGFLELSEGIRDRQNDSLSSRTVEVLRDSKHPAHGIYFDAQVKRCIEKLRAALWPGERRFDVQIPEMIV